MHYTTKRLRRWWVPFIAVFIVAGIIACSGNYGRVTHSEEVGRAFENFEMLDDYQYYFSGRVNVPSAIIGIDPVYEFTSDYWTLIEPEQFETMVGRLSPPEYGFLNGAYMLAPNGQKAGVWYSWVNTHFVKFDGNKIMVSNPEPFAEADGPAGIRSRR